MLNINNIFFKKKILIYGLGKSGMSAFKFLKKKNKVYLYDDKKIKDKSIELRRRLISYNKILKKNIDHIIISPGINVDKCRLSKFLKENLKKINTDLDIFYCTYGNNKNVTITGTNGKSTTAKIVHEVLKQQKIDSIFLRCESYLKKLRKNPSLKYIAEELEGSLKKLCEKAGKSNSEASGILNFQHISGTANRNYGANEIFFFSEMVKNSKIETL